MKKKVNILIMVIIVVILGLLIYFLVQHNEDKNKNYEIEKITDYKYFVSKDSKTQKFGVIDETGKVIVPEEYEDVKIPNPSKSVFICENENNTEVLNEMAQKIYTDYDEIEPLRLKNVSSDLIYEKSILKYKKDGRYGIINIGGEQLTQPIYEEIDTLQYKEGELLVKQNSKYGIINLNGQEMVKTEYDKIDADTFYENENQYRYDGYIVANKTDDGYRYGYISYTGEKYLDTVYNDMERITEIGERDEAFLLVAENGRYGIMKNDKQLIENEYQSISFDKGNQIFVVQKGKKYGAYDNSGKQILNCDFMQLDIKGKYLYARQDADKIEVYSKNGELANISSNTMITEIPEKKEYTINIQVDEENTSYQICKNDKPITEEKYRYIEYLQNDLFIASKAEENLGIIDINGQAKSEFIYTAIQIIPNTDLIQMTSSTQNIVKIADKNATQIVQMENATIAVGDYICVSDGMDKKYVTLDGKEATNQEIFATNTLFATSKDGKWGFADKSGNMKIEAIYDKVTEFNKYGFAGIYKDEKWGVVKQDGTIILEPTYTNIFSQNDPDFIGVYYQVQYGAGQIYYAR